VTCEHVTSKTCDSPWSAKLFALIRLIAITTPPTPDHQQPASQQPAAQQPAAQQRTHLHQADTAAAAPTRPFSPHLLTKLLMNDAHDNLQKTIRDLQGHKAEEDDLQSELQAQLEQSHQEEKDLSAQLQGAQEKLEAEQAKHIELGHSISIQRSATRLKKNSGEREIP
jgi:hypothetical protein